MTSLELARSALTRRDWEQAYEALHAVDPADLTGRDLEGLADAAWWTSRFPESLDARHRSYEAYVAAGDQAAAAAAAARLAIEHFVREEPSVGGGYLMRAQRHAKDLPEGPEQGFLAMVEANVARFSGDMVGALARARDAIAIGQRYGVPDLAAMALHAEGLTLLDAGEISAGLARMDEAMIDVLSGALDPYFTGIIFCSLIAACLELNDIRRAGEWSDAARTWCDTLQPGSPFPGMCRVNRAEVARLRGSWDEAAAEAELASKELEAIEPGLAGLALVQVGEIQRRRGALGGAEAAFARAHELGADPQPWLALLRQMQGKREAARTGLQNALTSEHQPARRARLLWAQVEVAISARALDDAAMAVGELEAIASTSGAPALQALALTAGGTYRLAGGDAAGALERLRAATVSWQQLKLPWETARARVLVGQALAAGGDDGGAQAEYRSALASFERLGAGPDAAEVRRLMGAAEALPGGLTAREAEVLRLVAAGKTNRDIAVELVISEHTVARHLQNLFAKVGVTSRAAATAFAYEHDLA
ncbi:MAG: LuxR C-terminal-related transcriptional regulator [Actinomycetota bacterium]|nr:LuxR C-terminal-related transcriptional regulator [Actinomycetota bacterium]